MGPPYGQTFIRPVRAQNSIAAKQFLSQTRTLASINALKALANLTALSIERESGQVAHRLGGTTQLT